MLQEIVTYIIIAVTTVYAMYHTYRFFTYIPPKSSCGSCAGCSCGTKDIKAKSKTKMAIPVKNY